MARERLRRRDASRVLVVEDDPIVSDVIAAALALEGFEPICVDDPTDAVRRAHEVTPDAITLDLQMPGIDGRCVLRHLREDPHTSSVPIVVVSADCERMSTQERNLASDALEKPFAIPDLIDALHAAIRRAHPNGGTVCPR